MKFDLAPGKSAESFPTEEQALAVSTLAPVLRSLVHDGVSVSPCYLRVAAAPAEHFFPAFYLQIFDAAGVQTGEGLLLAVTEDGRISTDTVWIPPTLLDGEQFSIAHFSHGQLQSV